MCMCMSRVHPARCGYCTGNARSTSRTHHAAHRRGDAWRWTRASSLCFGRCCMLASRHGPRNARRKWKRIKVERCRWPFLPLRVVGGQRRAGGRAAGPRNIYTSAGQVVMAFNAAHGTSWYAGATGTGAGVVCVGSYNSWGFRSRSRYFLWMRKAGLLRSQSQ